MEDNNVYVSFCMVLESMWDNLKDNVRTGMCTGKSLYRKVDECICM